MKRADIADHSDPERLAQLPAKTAQRLRLKYRNATKKLDANMASCGRPGNVVTRIQLTTSLTATSGVATATRARDHPYGDYPIKGVSGIFDYATSYLNRVRSVLDLTQRLGGSISVQSAASILPVSVRMVIIVPRPVYSRTASFALEDS